MELFGAVVTIVESFVNSLVIAAGFAVDVRAAMMGALRSVVVDVKKLL